MHTPKVLHLFDEYLPPSQIWAYNLLRHLEGVEVHIGARYFWKQNFYDEAFQFTDPLGISYARFTKSRNRSFRERLWLKISQISMIRSNMFDNYLIDYVKLNRIDAIHVHFGPVGWEFMNIAKSCGLPYLVSFYGYDYQKLLKVNPVFRSRYQELFQEVDLVISEGPHAKAQLCHIGVPANKAVVSPLGVDLSQVPFVLRNKQAASLHLIQVASFTEKKGHLYTVQAFAKALQTCPNMKLDLIGRDRDGQSLRKVKELVEAEGIANKVTFMDFVPYEDLGNHLERSDVFIHPSCTAEDGDTEGGAPVILLEAQASGLPVISTKHCDIPSVVAVGKSALLVEERQVTALSEALKFFYHLDQDAYQQWSRAARQQVAENYDIKKSAGVLRQHYRILLNSARTK